MQPTFDDHVNGYHDVADQLPRYVHRRAEEAFATDHPDPTALSAVPAAERYATRMREHFLDAIGGLPEREGRLNPVITGTITREGYEIETVIFESQPEFHVTGNLYLPAERTGPMPAVLFLCGHADEGKAAARYQQVCIALARNGIATLAIDPLGQGERHQYYDPATGTCPRQTTIEHTYLDRRYALAGANVARHLVWDGIRAIDYLVDRPEIDPARIGVTGNSGGGTQTAYLLLTEDRLAAGAPCCFITSRQAYMPTGQPQDGEQIIAESIARGPTYHDFLAGFAPRPVRIGAAEWDYFPIEGARESYQRAEAVYALYDASEAIDLNTVSERHGFSPPLREGVVNWFREHLRGAAPDYTAGDPATNAPETLQCTPAGEVRAAYPDGTRVQDLIREYVTARLANGPDPPAQATVRDRVVDVFELDRERPPINPRRMETERAESLVWEKVFFQSEPDIIVTGVIARDPDREPTAMEPTIALYETGTDALPERIAEFTDRAHRRGFLMAFDPRGIGAVQSRDVNDHEHHSTHGTVYKLMADARMLGKSLFGGQVFDVLRAGDYLRNRLGPEVALGLHGVGTGGWRAVYAAVGEPQFRRINVAEVPSLRALARAGSDRFDPWLYLYDVIGTLDRPAIEGALSDRELRWTV